MSTVTPRARTHPATAHDHCLGNAVIDNIRTYIAASNINNNSFYRTFTARPLDSGTTKHVFQQYYYYIRTFPQILAGLAYRVDSELIRMKLSRTVVSELGDNGEGKPHFEMFEDVLASVGVTLDDWQQVSHIREAEDLVAGLRHMFLHEPVNGAIGAHYVIEEFGFPMIAALYEGFRKYPGWTHGHYGYFYLHLLVEANHVDWITDAVIDAARSPSAARELENGARKVLSLLQRFWDGLDREARERQGSAVVDHDLEAGLP